MKDCEAYRRVISAYVDGELVGEDRTAFEAHAAACASCRASLADERAVMAFVHEARPVYIAPPRLRAAVAARLESPRPRAVPRVALALALVAAALVAMVFFVRPPLAHEPAMPSELAVVAARSHLGYTRDALPLEIASEEPRRVSQWFERRVPFHLKLPDYPLQPGEEKPYRLVGARLVSFRNDAAAFVAYRMGARPISLLVTSATLVRPARGEVVRAGSLLFHVESVEGLKVITWTDRGLTYALASDLDVEGAQSCLVCHGSPEERRKLAPLRRRPL